MLHVGYNPITLLLRNAKFSLHGKCNRFHFPKNYFREERFRIRKPYFARFAHVRALGTLAVDFVYSRFCSIFFAESFAFAKNAFA